MLVRQKFFKAAPRLNLFLWTTRALSIRMAFDVMRADAIEDVRVDVLVNGEGEAVRVGDPNCPDVSTFRVTFSFQLVCPQGAVAEVGHE